MSDFLTDTDVGIEAPPPFDAAKPFETPKMPGMLEAGMQGVVSGTKQLGQTAESITGQKPTTETDASPAAAPFEMADLTSPIESGAPKVAYRLGQSYPALVTGAAGAVIGGAGGTALAGPPGTAVGSIVGGTVGTAIGAAAQTLGPSFAEELKASPEDPDGAWNRALHKAEIAGVFGGASWALFPARFFQGPVKQALFQAFGVQPGVSVAHRATENVISGKPVGEGLGEAYTEGAVMTAVPAAGHKIASKTLEAVGGAREKPVQPIEGAPAFDPNAEFTSERSKHQEVEAAAAETNIDPSDAQKKLGNYKKGEVDIGGMTVKIENPRGAERSGVGPDGAPWAVTMPDHYGYVKGTKGADGDPVDVFVGPNPESQKVFVVDQNDARTGKFDEHKALIGFDDKESALDSYERSFSDGKGPDRVGNVTEMAVPEFKKWAKSEEPENGPVDKPDLGPVTGNKPMDDLPRSTQDDIASVLIDNVPEFSDYVRGDTEMARGLIHGQVPTLTVHQGRAPAKDFDISNRDVSTAAVNKYKKMGTEPPPVVVADGKVLEGGHRIAVAQAKGADIDFVDISGLMKMDWKKWLDGGEPTTKEMTNAERPEDTGAAGRGGTGGGRSVEEAQTAAATAAGDAPVLKGLPTKPLLIDGEYYVPGPNAKIHEVARSYMEGKPYDPPKEYVPVNPEHAKRIADAFDQMEHAPDDPKVKASYDAMINEVTDQWRAIRDSGLKVEFIKPGQEDPYAASPRLAAKDMADNNHLWVFPTDLGFGMEGDATSAAQHPMLRPVGEVIDGRPVVANDLLRIVHDYFGHFKDGNGFRASGEDNAWRSHAAMFSDEARPAMTTETRGQNSWVNYGPEAEFNKTASAADTKYAAQKVGLLPDWAMADAEPKKPAVSGAEKKPGRDGLFNPLQIPEDAPAKIARKMKRTKEGVGAPANEAPVRLPDGTYVGPVNLSQWITRVKKSLSDDEIGQARNWYKDALPLYEKYFGKELAPEMMGAWMIANQNATPQFAQLSATRAIEQYMNKSQGSPVPGLAAGRLQKYWDAILSGDAEKWKELSTGQKIYDFIDSGLGKDTRTFYGDDPRAGAPAVADVHSLRDTGTIDAVMHRWIADKFGPKVAEKITPDPDPSGVNEAKYEWAADRMREWTAQLNKQNFMGSSDWTPSEVQAVGWMAMSKLLGRAGQTAEKAITGNIRNLSYELDFGAGAPWHETFPEWKSLSTEQKADISKTILGDAMDFAKEITGGKEFVRIAGSGGWGADVNPSFRSRFIASPEVSGDIANIMGYLTQQTAVFESRWVNNGGKLGLVLSGKGLDSDSALRNVWSQVVEKHPDLAVGFSPTKTADGTPGMEMTFSGGGTKLQARIEKELLPTVNAAAKSLGLDTTTEMFRAETALHSNDWTKHPDGGEYAQRLRERYGPSIQERLDDYAGSKLEPSLREEIDRAKGPGEKETRKPVKPARSSRAFNPFEKTDEYRIAAQKNREKGGGGAKVYKSTAALERDRGGSPKKGTPEYEEELSDMRHKEEATQERETVLRADNPERYEGFFKRGGAVTNRDNFGNSDRRFSRTIRATKGVTRGVRTSNH